MGRPYSMDLRNRVVAKVETGGMSRHEAAARFGVGVSTAIRWMQSYGCRAFVEREVLLPARWVVTNRENLWVSIGTG